MLRRLTACGSIAAMLFLMSHAVVRAQGSNFSNGRTTNGLFGQTTVGGNSSTNIGMNSGSSGGSSGGNSSSSGSSSGAAPSNIALTTEMLRPPVETSQQRGAFVGADSADTTNMRSLQGTNARRTSSANSGLAQLENLFTQGLQNINRNNQSGSQVQIPVALRLGFAPQPASLTGVQAFQTRLNRLPSIRFVGPAEVSMEGRTAVLRGKVASEDDRKLAQALALMEPDVLKVRNELVVDPSAATAEELPQSPTTSPPSSTPPPPTPNLP